MTQRNPANEGATLLFQMAPNFTIPYEYGGVDKEINAYQKSAWIGTTLMMSSIYDIYGPDAADFLTSITINDFTNLGMENIRHAVICNDKGQIISDGVVMRITEDRYRTYWLNPPIDYLVQTSKYDVQGEDISGKEYFIQISGERSLEILEDAFQADLHDIKFARHRTENMDGRKVRILRLGMSGNLGYEIHGPIEDYEYVYDQIWESGKKYEAQKLGQHAYNAFNHTEGGFPNIGIHYPLPMFESDEGLAKYLNDNPELGAFSSNRKLIGSVGDNLETRFVTPYDLGWEKLIKFDTEFTGKEALKKISENPPRTVATLEWNPNDVGKVFAERLKGEENMPDDISKKSDFDMVKSTFDGNIIYHADKVFVGEKEMGITTGRIISYTYNRMISLAFINPEYAKEGKELTILWGTPSNKQMKIRAKVASFPYNSNFTRNRDKDVDNIPKFNE